MLLDMPPLPSVRSPLPSRRRTLPSYASSASSSSSSSFSFSTPRTPRLPRTHYSSTEDFSYSASSTPRLTRSSYSRRSYSREPSPSSYSRHGSRETSPSPPSSSSTFTTIGLPTYLRTCTMYGKPFTKAMRAGRLLTKHAEVVLFPIESFHYWKCCFFPFCNPIPSSCFPPNPRMVRLNGWRPPARLPAYLQQSSAHCSTQNSQFIWYALPAKPP